MNDFEVILNLDCTYKSYQDYNETPLFEYRPLTYHTYLVNHYPTFIQRGKLTNPIITDGYHYIITFYSEAHYTWWLLKQ